ncbi:MAG: glycosyltransferase family 4 protein [Elusimicrobiota bacterium]|jgi:glycosyltransferase involved in cell wall biosynthesis
MKPLLVFYSDCPVFGGADMLVAHLLADPGIRSRFETAILHRSHPAFDEGAARFLPPGTRRIGVSLPDRVQSVQALEARWGRGARLSAAKILWRLFDALLFPYAVLRLWAVLRALRPAVVHVNDGGYPGALGCRAAVLAARLAGARVLLAVHNQTRPLSLPADLLDLLVDPFVGRAADLLVTASKTAQDSLAARLPRAKMRIVPDGVPVPRVARAAASVRAELGAAPGRTLFVTTAFFEPRKGHLVLVEAARRLPPGSARFALIGSGPEEEAVRAAVRAAGLEESFVFLGYRPDHGELLAAADALVLPSVHSEDMPLVLLDAMALGKPVVSTRLAGIPAAVEDGVTGLLAEPGDPAGLAEALRRLCADAALRARLGEAGRRRFAERFEVSGMARAYAALYAALLGD